ncbi:armadillo repeat-containing protein 6 isoform X1 [Solanum pennellii]|uniref:Armadillo repeat-containing protein 6 isoform X1 n=1 Tax=Solanum pennellii TaxID=28526 RepID=A0ABM1FMR6_SOLPN|nr:armadillo repeat-containing protein 6 isoform X1 [Solanum pennellii]
MAPPKSVRSISQQAFDELVKENIEDLGMDSTEALEDAIQTLTLQGVDLSGIVTSILDSGEENPVMQSLEKLKELDRDCKQGDGDETDVKEIIEWLDKLNDACHVDGSGNTAIATKNGAIELVCSICGKLGSEGLVSALKTLVSLLHDLQSTEIFREINGPKMVMNILKNRKENISILNSGFAVVSAAATGNEVLKEAFMNLKIDELILQCLREFSRGSIPCVYDAVRVLLTSDDNRVVASEVYGYARRFAKVGIVEALVDSLHDGIKAPSLVSASVALKAIAVNDEICRAVAENGGIDAILRCIDDSSEQGEKVVAITCCSLLSKLAGSDINKSAIVDKDGMNKLMKLATRFSDDPAVLHEVMSMITVLSLRFPHNAACAIEAGAGDIVIQAMQRFPESELLQRSCCFMIRNLVVRNPENRTILLGNGIEKLIRKAKMNYKSCKNAATDALRDLGLDNYYL